MTSYFRQLPTEIHLGILKALPNFDALLSLIQVSKGLYDTWKANEYSICESIAKTTLGPLWLDAYALLIFQSRLKREADYIWDIRNILTDFTADQEVGWGALAGGTHIGISEVSQLLKYIERIGYWRADLLRHTQVDGRISADHQFRIDRAFLRYWVILLATAPQLISHEEGLLWARRHGDPVDSIIFHVEDIERRRRQKRLEEFQAVEPFLRYKGRERELIELSGVAFRGRSLASLPGTAAEGGAHYYTTWVNEPSLRNCALAHITYAVFLLRKTDTAE